MRFRSAAQFLAPLTPLILQGLKTKRKGKSPMGRAMSQILTCGFVGGFPRLEIDPGKAMLSDGIVVNPLRTVASRQGRTITVSWEQHDEDDAVSHCYPDDGIIICGYGIRVRTVALNEPEVQRKDNRAVLVLPDELVAETVHLYLMAHSRDKMQFSKSLYLGAFSPGE